MPQITKWACPKTGAEFATLDDYRAYLRHEAGKRIARIRAKQFMRAATNDLRRLTTFEEIADWLVAHGGMLGARAAYAAQTHWFTRHGRGDRQDEARDNPLLKEPFAFRKVRFTNMRRVEDLGRYAPLGHRHPGLMRSGWKGGIQYVYTGERHDVFEETGIRTGTGSGISSCRKTKRLGTGHYDVVLLDADFRQLSIFHRLRDA